MADFTVSTDVDALMRSADNAAIKTQLGISSPEAIMNPLVEGQGLLNSFKGSAAAYSLRDLTKTDPDVVEVRRASDDTTRSFKAGEIGSTLTNWVNAEVALPLDKTSGSLSAYENYQWLEDGDDNVVLSTPFTVTNNSFIEWACVSDGDREAYFWSNASNRIIVKNDELILIADGQSATITITEPLKNGSVLKLNFTSSGTTLDVDGELAATSGKVFVGKDIGRINPESAGWTTNGMGYVNVNFNNEIKYLGYGATPWDDVIGTNDGTPSRAFPVRRGNGAAAAYSLRNLSTSYSGNVVNVRRSSDGATADFTAAEVADGPLLAWVGTGGTDSGHVTKWYDQSGNNNHAEQTTEASQPKVVDAGTLVDGLKFDGADDFFSFVNPLSLTDGFLSFVSKLDTSDGTQSLLGSTLGSNDTYLGIWQSGSTNTITYREVTVDNHYQNGIAAIAPATRADSFNLFVTNNTQLVTLEGITTTENLLELGKGGGDVGSTWYTNGTISEIIIYDSDQSDNRKAIESNMADHHTIDLDASVDHDSGFDQVDGYVTTWYDQSGNANNAVQTVATSQPKIVDAGVLVTDGIKFDGVDDWLQAVGFAFSPSGNFNTFTAANFSNNNYWDTRDAAGDGLFLQRGASEFRSNYNGTKSAITAGAGDVLLSSELDGTEHNLYLNGGSKTTTTVVAGLSTTANFQIGSSFNSVHGTGTIREVIIYDSDQSAFRTNIEYNINNAYSIY